MPEAEEGEGLPGPWGHPHRHRVGAAELVLRRDSKRAATWQRFHCGALLLGREPWSRTPRCVPLLVAAVPRPLPLTKRWRCPEAPQSGRRAGWLTRGQTAQGTKKKKGPPRFCMLGTNGSREDEKMKGGEQAAV